MRQCPTKEGGIGCVKFVEERYNVFLIPVRLLIAYHEFAFVVDPCRFAFEQFGCQHWRERDGNGGGGHDADSDNPSQFLEEDARLSAEQGEREEYGNDHEGGGNDTNPYLIRSVGCRSVRVFATLHVFGDILQDHDGIIDHHTDGDGERTERYDVDGTIGNVEIKERNDEGDWYGDGNDVS